MSLRLTFWTLDRILCQDKCFLSPFNESLSSSSNLEARALLLEGIHTRLLEQSFADAPARQSETVEERRKLDGLVKLNARRVKRNQNYSSLLRVLALLFCLGAMVLVQRQTGMIFAATDPLVRVLQGDLDAESFTLSSPSEIYAMLDRLTRAVLRDAKCGDGVCEMNEFEFPGFGRFGCQADCGKYPKTSLITVHLKDFFSSSESYGGWDLSKIRRSQSPGFKWNIYSDTMGGYIFQSHRNLNGDKEVVEVPDGRCELRLFQTHKLHDAVDADAIAAALMMVPTSLPSRSPDINDFKYGDAREALASATTVVQDVNAHCWIGGDPAKFDMNCLNHPVVDTLYKALASYGVEGSVTVPGTGKAARTLATVKLCGMLTAGLQGVANSTNKEDLKKASLRCTAARRQMAGAGVDETSGAAHTSSRPSMQRRELLQALSGREGPCIWHDGCDQTVLDPLTRVAGQFCAKGGYCEVCSFCQIDATDAVDGVCPMRFCPGSGRLPQCISAAKLVQTHWQCKDSYAFSVWKYHDSSRGVPAVIPRSSPQPRFIAPGTQVIGSIGIAVRRSGKRQCGPFANKHLQLFASRVGMCASSNWDPAPYGFDAIFLPSSPLFDGNLRTQDVYSTAERRNATGQAHSNTNTVIGTEGSKAGGDGVPFLFFPHSYDSVKKMAKDPGLVAKEFKDTFMIYLDTRLSSESGARIVQLVQEGGLLDEQVKEVRALVLGLMCMCMCMCM